MDTLLHDLRHAVRMARQSPAFTAAAVASLALGIGANTAIFSVVNTVLLRPLPYPEPSRLVYFTNTSPQGSGPDVIAAPPVGAGSFRLFGAPVALGRTFTAAEDLPNGGRVVVLSDGFWRRRFGADRAVVGRTMSLNGEPHDIIGVLGPCEHEAWA